MRRTLGHPLTLTALVVVGLYLLFGHAMQPPMPRSLLIQFMIFGVIGTLMVATFDDATCRRLFEPIGTLLGSPRLRLWRWTAFVVVVAATAAITYDWVRPRRSAPLELRTVHPAPPSTLQVYGRKFDLARLRNPLRADAPKGSEKYREEVEAGREIYYRNCVYCHGDRLEGNGQFAAAFDPRPANFQDIGTIAQLQESYLFWRIATGAPGLPREGAPWSSAMPAWHEVLDEEEVWRVILFLYDYTGFEPRSWELDEAKAARPDGAEAGTADRGSADDAGDAAIERIYQSRCASCHGEEGEGDGPAAEFLYPKPRDFSLGVLKFKTTHADAEFPSDDDLRKTIQDGLPGTSMPEWGSTLTAAQIDGLIRLIKMFGGWDEEDADLRPIDLGETVPASPESLARGAKSYVKACEQCHGINGRGNVTSGKKLKDDWGDRIWPRNLTRPETWRWTKDATDVFQRISSGIRGTPMPQHTTTMSVSDRWDVANYVMTLRDNGVPPTGETVLRAVRTEGALPSDPEDAAWEQAPPLTFPLVPNIVKEPRLFYTLNDWITVRAVFNGEALALRLDVDDRTRSIPGDEDERRYRDDDIDPTRDAVAVQFPALVSATAEKPWFRHGDPSHPVNIWYWRAPSREPVADAEVVLLDAAGPDKPPARRDGLTGLTGTGVWRDGRWSVVLSRFLETEDPRDLRFEPGAYVPVSFANWDGWAGQSGARHGLTRWYWLRLEPEDRPILVYGSSGAGGVLAGLLFLVVARHQQRRRT